MSLRRDEQGQGMAEFALVLPLLALLTFGTIEVAIYLQQQSTLNAAAFLAARSASVLANESGVTKKAVEGFSEEAGSAWLQEAVAGMKSDHAKDRSRFKLEAKTDRFSGMIDALTNGQAKGLDTLSAEATLPLEYDHKKFKERSPTSVAKTMYMVSYASKNWAPNPDPVKLAPRNIGLVQQQLAPLRGLVLKFTATTQVGGNPTPAPGPNPAPKPRPRPKPRTEAGGGGGNPPAPGPKPPGPGPSTVTQNFTIPIEIPGVQEILALQVGEFEPFRTVGAVVPNPHHRRDTGDGGQFTSNEYLAPLYEQHVNNDVNAIRRGAYRIQNMLSELEKYEQQLAAGQGSGGKQGNTLMPACTALGTFPVDHAPIPPGLALSPAAVAAANAAWVPIARKIDSARKNAGRYAEQAGNGAKTTYDRMEPNERRLFRP